jgi:hypothetical protein
MSVQTNSPGAPGGPASPGAPRKLWLGGNESPRAPFSPCRMRGTIIHCHQKIVIPLLGNKYLTFKKFPRSMKRHHKQRTSEERDLH